MISTHILDTTAGCPASNVEVVLEKHSEESWQILDSQQTNNDGRIVFNSPFEEGLYRLTFMTEKYFNEQTHFFINPQVQFQIKDTKRKYHVPIILNPYGYSTYRGS